MSVDISCIVESVRSYVEGASYQVA